MTDEEILDMYADCTQSAPSSLRCIFQAGYRAGLEEVRNTFVDIQRKSMAIDTCDVFSNWLDAKLKEQL